MFIRATIHHPGSLRLGLLRSGRREDWDIPALPIRPAMRLRIGHALTPGRPCHIG